MNKLYIRTRTKHSYSGYSSHIITDFCFIKSELSSDKVAVEIIARDEYGRVVILDKHDYAVVDRSELEGANKKTVKPLLERVAKKQEAARVEIELCKELQLLIARAV